ncbi:sulfotransferase [Fulvivirga sp. 29W222]|uniref:Sulfotransferase n=1 Tax=Fulvivirga marina TaxID=2494733 RepID=A0A937G0L7_9BACT|nr:sulfotransferase [Fulvivirga marina]MBL6448333.1 sulfotransferase [Fulvivirga marina]
MEACYPDKKATECHPIFIIGAPRTGSTLLYQLLTNNTEVIYISNFVNLFHRNLFAGFVLNGLLLKGHRRIHNSFSSDFGNTLKSGWNAPSESGNFWYNWLSKTNDYEENNNISQKKINRLQKLFNRVMALYERPIVFKNLNNSQRLPLISKIDPQSKIIWIKRDHVYNAQSIILARQKYNVSPNEIWSVHPKGLSPDDCSNEFELVANQIKLIEEKIREDLKLFPEENTLTINYENLEDMLPDILQFCGIKLDSLNMLRPHIKTKNSQRLSSEDWNRLQIEIQSLSLPQ